MAEIELNPFTPRFNKIPSDANPGVDTSTVSVLGTDPIVIPEYVMVMDCTEQSSFPPTSLTVTLTDPDDVNLGAAIVGPGMNAGFTGKGVGTTGDGTGVGVGIGDGDGSVGLMSYRLISLQEVYVFLPAEPIKGYSTSVARSSQSVAARARAQTSGLLAAIRTNSPCLPSTGCTDQS
jgi:hypothetical protein